MSVTVTAFAPASIGNLGVGFDMLGVAMANVGDTIVARRVDRAGVSIEEIRDVDGAVHPHLSTAAHENTASIAAQSLWNFARQKGGVSLQIHKGIPLQSGMGSSAASAVAAVTAVNPLLENPLEIEQLLPFAIDGEKIASGGLHADNVAPSLFGGLVLCPSVLLPATVRIAAPAGVSSVLLHPDLQVNTAESRKALEAVYSMNQWLTQQGYLAGFIAACEHDDRALLRKCLRDDVIEPQRAGLVPCFKDVKEAAISGGAFGCSLSGSGPSIFALCDDEDANHIAAAMERACRKRGYACQSWVSPLDAPGASAVIDA